MFLLVLLLLLLLVICFLGVWGLVHFLNRGERIAQAHTVPPATDQVVTFPQPRLQPVAGRAYTKDLAAQEKELNTYGWVDRNQGVAHIPITNAMQLLLQRGLPAVGGGQTRVQLMQARPQTDLQPNETPAPTP